MTVSTASATTEEMSSYYASFCSDDSLIEIIPSFDFDNNHSSNDQGSSSLQLLSSVPIGPFIAGIPAIVPIWIGLFLHHRSLASIVLPSWLNTNNIATIIQYERTNGSLYHNVQTLPLNYYEISNRLLKLLLRSTSTTNTTSSSSSGAMNSNSNNNTNLDAIQLLIQDLLDIRMDKLRKQFQDLSSSTDNVDNLIVDVTGIGTQERAILQKFVAQALSDYHYLNKATSELSVTDDIDKNTTASTTESSTHNEKENDAVLNATTPINNDEGTPATSRADETLQQLPIKRSIRRFR